MKRIFSNFLVVASLLFLVGCGGGDDKQTVITPQTTKQVVSDASVNSTPVATFSNFSINKDVRYDGQLTAMDADGDNITYVIVTEPSHGSVVLHDNGCFTYIPNDGYEGIDTFSYRASDDTSSCAVKTVTVNVNEPTVEKPVAPSNLQAIAVSYTSLKLTWSDNSDNEDGFVIYRDGKPICTTNANVTTFTISCGLEAGTTYDFEVKAQNEAGASMPTSAQGSTKDVTTPPLAPTELKITAVEKTALRLTWKDNADNESGFIIYQNGVELKRVSSGCNCIVIDQLKECKSYRFRVEAINKIGSASSDEINIETACEIEVKAFFGDKENNTVLVVDVQNMELVKSEPTSHLITYAIDKVPTKSKVYISNRGSNALDVMDINSLEIIKTIKLEHYPRSADAFNNTLGLCEVSGMDKAMVSIIDINTDEVVAVVGDNTPVDSANNPNHGGSHATGHPYWLDDNHFVLLDRYNRKIITYSIEKDGMNWNVNKLNELNTTTSIHQIVPRNGNYNGDDSLFYATEEGSDINYPAVLELKLTTDGLNLVRKLELRDGNISMQDMTLHHGDFNSFNKSIYIGSVNGTMFVVDYENMSIKNLIKAGKGAGHVSFVPEKNLALIINHKDVFITAVDMRTDEKIKDIKVSNSDNLVGNSTIQAHTQYYVSEDNKYFYSFLTSDGLMYKVDLDTLCLVQTLDVGGMPAMGTFVKYSK